MWLHTPRSSLSVAASEARTYPPPHEAGARRGQGGDWNALRRIGRPGELRWNEEGCPRVSINSRAERGCGRIAERGVRGEPRHNLYCVDLVRQDAVTIRREQTRPNKRQLLGKEQLGIGVRRSRWQLK